MFLLLSLIRLGDVGDQREVIVFDLEELGSVVFEVKQRRLPPSVSHPSMEIIILSLSHCYNRGGKRDREASFCFFQSVYQSLLRSDPALRPASNHSYLAARFLPIPIILILHQSMEDKISSFQYGCMHSLRPNIQAFLKSI